MSFEPEPDLDPFLPDLDPGSGSKDMVMDPFRLYSGHPSLV